MTVKLCLVDGCNTPVGKHGAKGFCPSHYQRYKKYGDPLAGGKIRKSRSQNLNNDQLINYIKNNYTINSETDCHEWDGPKSERGYGKISHKGRHYRAHRLLCELVYKIKLSPNQVVRHTCDNPCCINLEHLVIGPPVKNSQDMVERGRSLKGERNPVSKLENSEVIEIKKQLKQGISQRKIAKEFNVNQVTISRIKRGISWEHIKI